MNNLKKFFLFTLLVVLSSCSNNLKTEGNFIFPNNLEKLHVGMTKNQVTDLLGPATVLANFDENVWYYIYEISNRKLRFLDKKVSDSKVIILKFNGSKIESIEVLDYKDRKKINVDNTQTKDILIKTKPNNSKLQKANSF